MKSRPIYLMGFMGCGKSTIGKSLAKKVGRKFVDLDNLIEKKVNKSISELFEQEGEDFFRKEETTLLTSTNFSNHVVALGGGTPCFNNNLKYIKQSGFSIYLKASEERLLGRLRQAKNKRPLIAKLTDEQLKIFIERQLGKREGFYTQADLIIETENFEWEELLGDLRNQELY